MKVLLVATNRERFPYPVAPLGVLYIASAARAAGHKVDFLDMGLESNPQRALKKALAKTPYGAVAFGIRNLDNCWEFAPHSYFDEVRLLAETVRQHSNSPLILGGTGVSVSPDGWMRRLKPECCVIGEGERPFVEVLARLDSGKSLEDIAGVMLPPVDSGQIIRHTQNVFRPTDDSLFPSHELCGYPDYVRRGGFVGVQTKRGCPFKCSYCIYPQLEGRRYRLRSPEAVIEEVEAVASGRKMRHFFFVDSVFNDPRKHALEVCRELARRKLGVKWMCFCNPVGFDLELAQAMVESGCIGVEFGLDEATPKMLAALHKPFKQDDIRIALQAAHDANLPVLLSMLFGGPGGTWADVEEAQAFLNSCAPVAAVFASYGIRIYEGTALAAQAVREGVIRSDQDFFEPVFYISPAMAEGTMERLDAIVRRKPEWSSPADWRRPIMSLAQKILVLFDARPPWKHIRGYGQHMRQQSI